ncbi:MAG TPA: deoxyribodipyrimidine photo-lyase [Verrucomicrobiae bacterium]|nr:deoxyribodipyrimidine photo-lyase [Verrucomicrobiae bacterium]
MSEKTTIVWFRLDLRLADNPALSAALASGVVVPVFIWAPEEECPWSPGSASRWWLHHSLAALARDLGGLVIRRGPSLDALRQLVKETGATAVFWNRRYEPALIARDTKVKQALIADGLQVESFNSALLFEPWEIKTVSGGPYKVFTPFYRACLAMGAIAQPSGRAVLRALRRLPESLRLDDLELLPKLDWARGFDWRPGETGALAALKRFESAKYAAQRDRPDIAGVSRLSPHLHFGEISPWRIWRTVHSGTYRRQLVWREFAHHLLYHFPSTPEKPFRSEFERFPWRNDQTALRAWQRGRTGYPIVDAGMRELWTTGWMHNRVRMMASSFLVKDLLLPWQEGARWFWDTLVDADLANNTLGWQWVAGCGVDAAPFFRIFNPAAQAEKFDPKGEYCRRWASEPVAPILEHSEARKRALAAFAKINKR